MEAEWYAHLPGLDLNEFNEVSIGLGRLVQLPFEEWEKLDSDFQWSDNDYRKSRPVFYAGKIDYDGNLQKAGKQVEAWVQQLYRALLLSPTMPLLPPPTLSTTYLTIPQNQERTNHAWEGATGLEWIVFGSGIRNPISGEHLPAVEEIYKVLEDYDPKSAFSGVEAGLRTLELIAFPEFWWDEQEINAINGFIHCMAALENILLPPVERSLKGMNITVAFGKHAAALTCQERNQLHEKATLYSDLYRLRSRLIHGELSAADLKPSERSLLNLGRHLLRVVLLWAIFARINRFAIGSINGDIQLPDLLAQAYEEEFFQQLIFRPRVVLQISRT